MPVKPGVFLSPCGVGQDAFCSLVALNCVGWYCGGDGPARVVQLSAGRPRLLYQRRCQHTCLIHRRDAKRKGAVGPMACARWPRLGVSFLVGIVPAPMGSAPRAPKDGAKLHGGRSRRGKETQGAGVGRADDGPGGELACVMPRRVPGLSSCRAVMSVALNSGSSARPHTLTRHAGAADAGMRNCAGSGA